MDLLLSSNWPASQTNISGHRMPREKKQFQNFPYILENWRHHSFGLTSTKELCFSKVATILLLIFAVNETKNAKNYMFNHCQDSSKWKRWEKTLLHLKKKTQFQSFCLNFTYFKKHKNLVSALFRSHLQKINLRLLWTSWSVNTTTWVMQTLWIMLLIIFEDQIYEAIPQVLFT